MNKWTSLKYQCISEHIQVKWRSASMSNTEIASSAHKFSVTKYSINHLTIAGSANNSKKTSYISVRMQANTTHDLF